MNKANSSNEDSKPIKILKIILESLFTGICCFAWMMIMLLIVSFVSLSFIHFEFETMLIISVVFGGLALFFQLIRKLLR